MWQKIYKKLEEKNLNPYPPGIYQGECTVRYCVVKENAQSGLMSNKVGYRLIDIIIFVPMSDYLAAKTYCDEVKLALKELPEIRKTGNETPVIPDDSVKGYTTSIEYQVYKKL